MKRLPRLLPRSLVGRVYALYAVTLLVFVGGSTALFYQYQFSLGLEEAQERADTLIAVAAPAVSDSAVIGDYDTIRRTLQEAIHHSDFASASYIDLAGGVISEVHASPSYVMPPRWLQARVARQLYDTNRPISAGGRDYGVLRLTFSPERIASDVWRQARVVIALALASLVGGLLLIRLPLVSWLGDLDQVRAYGVAMQTGSFTPVHEPSANRPSELQETFDVLDRAAASLQAQREQASVTLAAIGDGVLTLDATGCVLFANPVAAQMMQMQPADMVGRSVRRLCPEVFPDGTQLLPWRDHRSTVTRRIGQPMVVETTLSPICDAEGDTVGHVLACRDVTEKNALDQRLRLELAVREAAMTSLRGVLEGLMPQAQRPDAAGHHDDLGAVTRLISNLVAQLQERNEQLNTIFSLSPDGFVSFDAERVVNYVSPAFTRLTGQPESAFQGLTEEAFEARLATHCNPATPPRSFDHLRRTRVLDHEGKLKRELIDMERPARRVLEVRLRQSRSNAISQVFYLRDVTHESEVDRMKSEFLSTAAHELRTPMTSIYGFSELLLEMELPPGRQKEMLQIIYRQTGLMTSIINELLDLARIEARRGKDFQIDTVDLAEVAASVVRDFRPPRQRASPQTTAPGGTLPVRVDRNKMAQALGNVLSNAYKYSPGGGTVRLDFVQRHDPAGDLQFGVQVTDEGIGMSPGELLRVSERFYRANSSGNIPGTGLGMSIVKEIVELMGGALALESAPGQGTQVTLWLPAAPHA